MIVVAANNYRMTRKMGVGESHATDTHLALLLAHHRAFDTVRASLCLRHAYDNQCFGRSQATWTQLSSHTAYTI